MNARFKALFATALLALLSTAAPSARAQDVKERVIKLALANTADSAQASVPSGSPRS
jgi:hypothetical protein